MSPIDKSIVNLETQKFLATLNHVADYSVITPEMLRTRVACPYEIEEPPVTVEKLQIPTFSDGHLVDIEVYRPKNASAETALPVLVYLPGGGWTIQASEGHYYLVKKLAVETNCVVIMVHYSLSPEKRFPVALEECYSVISYATNPETAAKLNIDPTHVAIGGDSAGGNLSAAVTLLAKQRGDLQNSIKYQVLYYPATGDSFETGSYKAYADGFFLTKGLTEWFYHNYVTEDAKGNILFSPNLATTEELAGLPPALIVVAEVDVLRDDGEKYGRLLMKAGVPVTSVRVNHVIHSFMGNAWILTEETLVSIDMTASALRRAFAKK